MRAAQVQEQCQEPKPAPSPYAAPSHKLLPEGRHKERLDSTVFQKGGKVLSIESKRLGVMPRALCCRKTER